MAKIIFFDLWAEMVPYIKKKLKGHHLDFLNAADRKTIKQAANADIACTTIYSHIGSSEIAKMPRLKLIATLSTGFDHIDIAACAKQKILVTNVPSYGTQTVAEHTIALMLALAKKIVISAERTRMGNFSLEGLRTFDICNKTLGIIGFGKIGSAVAKIAKAFGMEVLVYDRKGAIKLAQSLAYKCVSFDQLLKKSDIISLHAPLTEKTKHMISKKALAKMKKGAMIINTARGGLIDTQALVQALISGHIAGAGLDVLESEIAIKEEVQLLSSHITPAELRTLIANQILCNRPDVIITPHNAFNSQEALQRIIDTTVANIKSYLRGHPVNIVKANK